MNILQITSSLRGAESESSRVTNSIVAKLVAANPGATVVTPMEVLSTHLMETIKAQPARFEAGNRVSEQFEARSKDGTMIPYFVVRRSDQKGPAPALLYAYGGFQVSQTPAYSGAMGKLRFVHDLVHDLVQAPAG